MDITPDLARQSLDEVEYTMQQVRRNVAGAGTDWILMIWGVVWIGCYITTHLLIPHAVDWITTVWMVGVGVGLAGMASVGIIFGRRAVVRSEQTRRLERHIGFFWLTLFAFASLWLFLFWPWHPIQMNAFLVTLVMFAYIVLGLWMASAFFVGLGIAVALATLVGYVLTAHAGFAYYNLWMAAAGGGGLLGSGLYIRYAWR